MEVKSVGRGGRGRGEGVQRLDGRGRGEHPSTKWGVKLVMHNDERRRKKQQEVVNSADG